VPRHPQLDLITPERVWQESLLAKVKGLIDWRVFEHLDKCGKEEIYRTCEGCGDWSSYLWRCNLKFCPLCNWRIARKRAEVLKLWSRTITQPKHLVITQRNFPVLTRKKIRDFGRAFGKLRRNKVWKEVKGGCVSTEITNEGRGWHLHAHVMLDARWIDMGKLAIVWGGLIGQEFGICKIKDIRGDAYLGEITKYVVKGSELVSWPAEEIAQFICAIKGVRFFAAFGTLFKLQRQIKAEIWNNRPEPEPCKCGCGEFRWSDERSEAIHDARMASKRR
jgi:hypothetical protein